MHSHQIHANPFSFIYHGMINVCVLCFMFCFLAASFQHKQKAADFCSHSPWCCGCQSRLSDADTNAPDMFIKCHSHCRKSLQGLVAVAGFNANADCGEIN